MKSRKSKIEKQEKYQLEFYLNDIVKKLHNVCYLVENIKQVPVSFMHISQHEDNFTVFFKSATEKYMLKLNAEDINIMESNQLFNLILEQSKIEIDQLVN